MSKFASMFAPATRDHVLDDKPGKPTLTLRAMDLDNVEFFADMRAREGAEKPDPTTADEIRAARAKEAADFHRWFVVGLTIDGVETSPSDSAEFLADMAAGDYTRFAKLWDFVKAAPQEARTDAIAGE